MIRVAEKKHGIYSKCFEGPSRVIKEKNNNSYEIEIGSKRFIRHEDHIKWSKAVKKISSYPCRSIISAINIKNEDKNPQRRYPKRERQLVQKYCFESERRGVL